MTAAVPSFPCRLYPGDDPAEAYCRERDSDGIPGQTGRPVPATPRAAPPALGTSGTAAVTRGTAPSAQPQKERENQRETPPAFLCPLDHSGQALCAAPGPASPAASQSSRVSSEEETKRGLANSSPSQRSFNHSYAALKAGAGTRAPEQLPLGVLCLNRFRASPPAPAACTNRAQSRGLTLP